jgi:hypothetical protein
MIKKFILFLILSLFFLFSNVSAEDIEISDQNIDNRDNNINLNEENIFANEINEDIKYNEKFSVTNEDTNDTRNDAEITLNVTNTTTGGNATIVITANPNATGNIIININNNTKYEFSLINSSAIKKIDNLAPGVYSINLTYMGDNNFKPFSKFYWQNFYISHYETNILANNIIMYFKNGTKFILTVVDSKGNPIGSPDVIALNKYVYITINNVTYEKRLSENGSVYLSLNLAPGNYSIYALFKGDIIFPASNLTTNLTVLPTISGGDIVMFFKNGSQYVVNLVDGKGKALANTNVTMNINGVFYTRTTDANGTARLNINLNSGNYTITAEGPDGLKISNNITVLPTISGGDLVMFFRNGSQYVVNLVDGKGKVLANTNVTMNINGVFYTRTTDANGTARLNINLNSGNYTITAETPNGLKISNNIEVLPILIGHDLNKTIGKNASYNVTVLDDKGELLKNATVKININGVFYDRVSDSNGIARLNINLSLGSYIATAMWNEYSTSNVINVLD